MSKPIEVTVTVGDKQITLKGPESFVREEVQRLTNTAVAARPFSVYAGDTEASIPSSERGLVALKKPSGHAETVAVLAYFLTQSGHVDFTPDDIRRAYARAGVRPPKVIAQSLRDAKNNNDYLERSGRGTFRLSPHGARTVEFDLPRKDAQ